MNNQEIVSKLWSLCNVLRDDGITYHQYVTELTYLLFLKMLKETGNEENIPEQYRWDELVSKEGVALKTFYRTLLLHLGTEGKGTVAQIYHNAQTHIDEPKNLRKIVKSIDELDWYSAREEGLGNLYEGLLEKNANEKKSGAGQYFTPRPLIDAMVELVDPQPGERCNDPACGTFGFMIAADAHVKAKTDNYYTLTEKQIEFQRQQAFSGCELVADTHRLAMMNALLHGMESDIVLGDTLTQIGEQMKGYDVVLANPPFGTKKGGERPTRSDFTYPTSNKQLNFLQHIYRSLKPGGRAAVVLPDNVLFQDGDGQKVRADLMAKCNLHTILRLPTGIFYAAGVKTNVLFFERGTTDKGNTKQVWYYDLRTNMDNFGKRTPFTRAHFNDFIKAYHADDRAAHTDERWQSFTRQEIEQRGDTLDLGLIADASLAGSTDLPDPKELATEAIDELEVVVDELKELLRLLEINEK
ncbi:class I SAM-dependent DNA methyltransferase [Hymenobacter sp. DG01]|uniref:class I SAM-dependent DNA methyltransferase n=1 Tax=Hymenobacter sp. DG01 TaxID=2584940 RepID=UPI001120848A|nr:class I SAM-dependent DNA methyltransferase [Hymenobacter sp. DG01]